MVRCSEGGGSKWPPQFLAESISTFLLYSDSCFVSYGPSRAVGRMVFA